MKTETRSAMLVGGAVAVVVIATIAGGKSAGSIAAIVVAAVVGAKAVFGSKA